MKKNLIIQLIFFLFVLKVDASCDYIREAAKLQYKIEDKIQKELKVHVGGTGGGMADCIYSFHCTIQTQPFINKNDARRMISRIMEIYLEEINRSKIIRPYLKDYPFTRKRIGLIILGDRPVRKPIEGDYYASVVYRQDIVIYEIKNTATPGIREEEETYDEMLHQLNKVSLMESL